VSALHKREPVDFKDIIAHARAHATNPNAPLAALLDIAGPVRWW
jgi:hypothetical protein